VNKKEEVEFPRGCCAAQWPLEHKATARCRKGDIKEKENKKINGKKK
jgi:hypothetical protein